MSYSDFLTIMLTAVTVVITVLAVFIGALAIWGYSQFEKMTQTASANHLTALLTDGPFRESIDRLIVKHVSDQLQEGQLRALLIQRVDALIMTDAESRSKSSAAVENEKPFKD